LKSIERGEHVGWRTALEHERMHHRGGRNVEREQRTRGVDEPADRVVVARIKARRVARAAHENSHGGCDRVGVDGHVVHECVSKKRPPAIRGTAGGRKFQSRFRMKSGARADRRSGKAGLASLVVMQLAFLFSTLDTSIRWSRMGAAGTTVACAGPLHLGNRFVSGGSWSWADGLEEALRSAALADGDLDGRAAARATPDVGGA
jgi:hypothetical protein